MKIKSFAKINLGLEVISKRPDGYHEIRTLFQSVGLFDILLISPLPRSRFRLSGTDKAISWGEDNLISRAVQSLRAACGVNLGAEIRVEKNIPPGKGLGGGSSNAAMTLYALNSFWSLGLSRERLMELGKGIGADVPYFLQGGLCLGSGRGDEIEPLDDLDPLVCLLCLPEFPVPTPAVYQAHRLPLTSSAKGSKITEFLNKRNVQSLENNLEETVLRLYPQLKTYKSRILSLNPDLSLVTGTGSAVFGLFRERGHVREDFVIPGGRGRSVLTETVPRDRYWNNGVAGV